MSCNRDLGIRVDKGPSQERWESLWQWFRKTGYPAAQLRISGELQVRCDIELLSVWWFYSRLVQRFVKLEFHKWRGWKAQVERRGSEVGHCTTWSALLLTYSKEKVQLLGETLILCAEMKWFETICKPRVRASRVRSKEKNDKRAKAALARAAQGVPSGMTVWTYQRGEQSRLRSGFPPEVLLLLFFLLRDK